MQDMIKLLRIAQEIVRETEDRRPGEGYVRVDPDTFADLKDEVERIEREAREAIAAYEARAKFIAETF